ncbi:unnamed protein product [Arctia plantaginis]|uniref:Uncharacterized protein n=1 Tax=Arctia plantaginis TaxID=874455 RepID=A0A8S0YUJ9_ARCPL|nr:unnamed protein product [Arctia plantaginis]
MMVLPMVQRDPTPSVPVTDENFLCIGIAQRQAVQNREVPAPRHKLVRAAPAPTPPLMQLVPVHVELKCNETWIPGKLMLNESLNLELKCNKVLLPISTALRTIAINVQLKCNQVIIHDAVVKNEDPICVKLKCNKQRVPITQTRSEAPVRIEVTLNKVPVHDALVCYEKSLFVELICKKVTGPMLYKGEERMICVELMCDKVMVCNAKAHHNTPLHIELKRADIPLLGGLKQTKTQPQSDDAVKDSDKPSENKLVAIDLSLRGKQSVFEIDPSDSKLIQNVHKHTQTGTENLPHLSKIITSPQIAAVNVLSNDARNPGVISSAPLFESLTCNTTVIKSTKFNISDNGYQEKDEFINQGQTKKRNQIVENYESSSKKLVNPSVSSLEKDNLVKSNTDIELPDYSGDEDDAPSNNMMRQPSTLTFEIAEKQKLKLQQALDPTETDKNLLPCKETFQTSSVSSKTQTATAIVSDLRLSHNIITSPRISKQCAMTPRHAKPKILGGHVPIKDLQKVNPTLKSDIVPCDPRLQKRNSQSFYSKNRINNEDISEKRLLYRSACARDNPQNEYREYSSTRKSASDSFNSQKKLTPLIFHGFEEDSSYRRNPRKTNTSPGTRRLPYIEIWGEYPATKTKQKLSQELNFTKEKPDLESSQKLNRTIDLDMPTIEDSPPPPRELLGYTSHVEPGQVLCPSVQAKDSPFLTEPLKTTPNSISDMRPIVQENSSQQYVLPVDKDFDSTELKINALQRNSDGIRKSLKYKIPSSRPGKNSLINCPKIEHNRETCESESLDILQKDPFTDTDFYLDPVRLIPRALPDDLKAEYTLIKQKGAYICRKIYSSTKQNVEQSKLQEIPVIPETNLLEPLLPLKRYTKDAAKNLDQPCVQFKNIVQRRNSQYLYEPDPKELSESPLKDRLKEKWLKNFISKSSRRRRHKSVPDTSNPVTSELLSPISASRDTLDDYNVAPVRQPLKIHEKSNSQIRIYPWSGGKIKKNILENKISLTTENNNEVSVTSLSQQLTKEAPKTVKNNNKEMSLTSENPQPLQICQKRHSKVRKTCKLNSQIKDVSAITSGSVVQQDNFASTAQEDCFKPESATSTPEKELVEMKIRKINTATTDIKKGRRLLRQNSQGQIEKNSCTKAESISPIFTHSQTLLNTREEHQIMDLVPEEHQPNDIHDISDLNPPLFAYSVPSCSSPASHIKENTEDLSPTKTVEHSANRACRSSQVRATRKELESVISDTPDHLLKLEPLDVTTKVSNKKYFTSGDRTLSEINEKRESSKSHDEHFVSKNNNGSLTPKSDYIEENCEKYTNSELVKDLPSLVNKDFLICLSSKKRRSPALTPSSNNSQETSLHISQTNKINKNVDLLAELNSESSKQNSHVVILEEIIIKRPKSESSNEDNCVNDNCIPTFSVMPNLLQKIPDDIPTDFTQKPVIKSNSNRPEDATTVKNEQGATAIENFMDNVKSADMQTSNESVQVEPTKEYADHLMNIPLPEMAPPVCDVPLHAIPLPSDDAKCSEAVNREHVSPICKMSPVFDVDDKKGACQQKNTETLHNFIYKVDALIVAASILPSNTTFLRIDKSHIPLVMLKEFLVLSDAYISCLQTSYYTLAPHDNVVEVLMDYDDDDDDNDKASIDLNFTKSDIDIPVSSNNNLVGDKNSAVNDNNSIARGNDARATEKHLISSGDTRDRGDTPDKGDIRDRGDTPDKGDTRQRGDIPDKGDTPVDNVSATIYNTHKILSVVVAPECFIDLGESDALMWVFAASPGRTFPLRRRVDEDKLVVDSCVDKVVLLELAAQVNAHCAADSRRRVVVGTVTE